MHCSERLIATRHTHTVSPAALFSIPVYARMFISMRITRPLCLVSCQTFGQGQSSRESAYVSVCASVCVERSGGTLVNCTDRQCERTLQ